MQPYRVAFVCVALLPALAAAQQPTRRRQAPIVIKGTVPTPQVVTVRPRAIPAYSRQVLVPRFYDHDFWPEIEQGYQLLADRTLGAPAFDSTATLVAAVGLPEMFLDSASTKKREPPKPPEPKRITVRRQMKWCAPHWWCPSERVTIVEKPYVPPSDTAHAGALISGPAVRQRWCTPHWWCPAGPIVPDTLKAPRDTTRVRPDSPRTRPDSTRTPRPPAGTAPARQR